MYDSENDKLKAIPETEGAERPTPDIDVELDEQEQEAGEGSEDTLEVEIEDDSDEEPDLEEVELYSPDDPQWEDPKDEAEEEPKEASDEEDRGYYKDVLEKDWEEVLAAQKAADAKAAKKAELKKKQDQKSKKQKEIDDRARQQREYLHEIQEAERQNEAVRFQQEFEARQREQAERDTQYREETTKDIPVPGYAQTNYKNTATRAMSPEQQPNSVPTIVVPIRLPKHENCPASVEPLKTATDTSYEAGTYNPDVAHNQEPEQKTEYQRPVSSDTSGTTGDEYVRHLAKQEERRNQEIRERHESEARQREIQRHEEFLKNAEQIRSREEAMLGKTVKSGHLDLHEGADNLVDAFDRSGANPILEPQGTANPGGSTYQNAAGRKGDNTPESPRAGTHVAYEYSPGGSVRQEEHQYSNDKSMNFQPPYRAQNERGKPTLDSGVARAQYTPNGVQIKSEVAGKYRGNTQDKQVVSAFAPAAAIAGGMRHQTNSGSFVEQERRREQSMPSFYETEKRRELKLYVDQYGQQAVSQNQTFARESTTSRVLNGRTTQNYGFTARRQDIKEAVTEAASAKRTGTGASKDPTILTNHLGTTANATKRDSAGRGSLDKAGTQTEKRGQVGIKRTADALSKSGNAAKFDYYRSRYGGVAVNTIKKAAALPIAVVLATAEEGIRDSGGGAGLKLLHDSKDVAAIAYYAMHNNGNKYIRQGTDGAFKTERALRKADKASTNALKILRQRRNQLIGSINRELRVSGNMGIALRSIEDVDKVLARADISPEARQKLKDLKQNMITTLKTGTWLDLNAKELNGRIDSASLQKLGARSVGELNGKKLNKLMTNMRKDNAREFNAFKDALGKDALAKLQIKSVNDLIRAAQSGKLQELIQNGRITGEAKELAEKVLKNFETRELLKKRSLVIKGKLNARFHKMAGRMLRRKLVTKLTHALHDNDEAGFHTMAETMETVRNARDAVRLAKSSGSMTLNTAKGAYNTGKKAVDLTKNVAKKADAVGRKLVDKQINGMLSDRFKTKPQIKKPMSPRLIDKQAKMKKQAEVAKKAAAASRKLSLKVADKTKAAAEGIKGALKSVVAAGQKLVAALGTMIGAVASLGALAIAGAVILIIVIAFVIISVFATDDDADVQRIVDKINTERDEVVLDSIYDSFRGETDPFGHPYGFTTLDGQTSDNLINGVTWDYQNGVSNNTAEIISLAAVYFQQNWPSSSDIVNLFSSDDRAFFRFCKDLAGYGLDVTAQESHPYSCMTRGGCVLGYRDLGQKVEIKDYKLTTTEHHCTEGNTAECGYFDWWGVWQWASEHGPGNTITDKKVEENGTHDVYVYFQNKLPDGAKQSGLTKLPDDYTVITDGAEIDSADVHGNLVFDASSCNLYKGVVDDWFVEPGEMTASFTVVTKLDDENERRDTYTITFGGTEGSFEAVPWCPGELSDSLHGHYDLNCTVYLVGYDEYTEPCLKPDDPANKDVAVDEDGIKGGTGTLVPLAKAINGGQLTRTVQKLNQGMMPYEGGTAARYTSTVTLPDPEPGFTVWYDENGKDKDGNVGWAKLLYSMDWEDLYGVTNGIKCRSFGSKFTNDEFDTIIGNMDFGDISDARQKVVAVAIKSSGQFYYNLGGKPQGGPGAVRVGGGLDCSGFIKYCYWMSGLSFQATNTADYPGAGDLRQISASELQPGDLQVMLSSDVGGAMGHVRMFLGYTNGRAQWAECVGSRGSLINQWSNTEAGMRNVRYYTYTGF